MGSYKLEIEYPTYSIQHKSVPYNDKYMKRNLATNEFYHIFDRYVGSRVSNISVPYRAD